MNKSASIAYLIGKSIIILKSRSEEGFTSTNATHLRNTLMQIPGFTQKDWEDIQCYAHTPITEEVFELQFEILDNLLFNIYEVSYALTILNNYYHAISEPSEDDLQIIKFLSNRVLSYRTMHKKQHQRNSNFDFDYAEEVSEFRLQSA